MIGDFCKPLNPGEDNTVRIVMTVGEAERLLDWLNAQSNLLGVQQDLWRVLKTVEGHRIEHQKRLARERTTIPLRNPELVPLTCAGCGKPIEGVEFMGKLKDGVLEPGAFHVECALGAPSRCMTCWPPDPSLSGRKL